MTILSQTARAAAAVVAAVAVLGAGGVTATAATSTPRAVVATTTATTAATTAASTAASTSATDTYATYRLGFEAVTSRDFVGLIVVSYSDPSHFYEPAALVPWCRSAVSRRRCT